MINLNKIAKELQSKVMMIKLLKITDIATLLKKKTDSFQTIKDINPKF